MLQDRYYDLWLYNSITDYKQINYTHETPTGINRLLSELRQPMSWLYVNYHGQYQYYLVVHNATNNTIKEMLRNVTKQNKHLTI